MVHEILRSLLIEQLLYTIFLVIFSINKAKTKSLYIMYNNKKINNIFFRLMLIHYMSSVYLKIIR